MKLKTYPKVFWKDANGKHPLRFIQVHGSTYEFQYDESRDIVLREI